MPPRPLTLVAELSYQCPLHCPYCSNPTDIGGDPLLIAPKGREPIVTHGNLGEDVSAELPKNPVSRSLKMFVWRNFE